MRNIDTVKLAERINKAVYNENEREAGKSVVVSDWAFDDVKWIVATITGKELTSGDCNRIAAAVRAETGRGAWANRYGKVGYAA